MSCNWDFIVSYCLGYLYGFGEARVSELFACFMLLS